MGKQPTTRCEFDADKLLLRLDEVLKPDMQAAIDLVDRIMETVTKMGCASGKETNVRLAMEEALTNAIVHGCQNDPTKEVQCFVLCDTERGILVIVRDPGPGFDPSSIPSPIVGENLYSSHGRGVFLINQMADEVRFERGGTEIHIRIR